MPKLRKRMTKDFTIISNTALRDTRLGSSERGLYCTMMSMAEDWNFSIRGFASIMPDGVTKISNALKKLEALGYLRRERQYVDGKIIDWIYYIYDEPYEPDSSDVENPENLARQDTGSQDAENLDTENLNQGQSHLEKPNDNIISRKEKSKKEISRDQESIDQSADADGQMDGYVQEKGIYTEVVKSNINYSDYALWAEESNGYMTVDELDEIVQMIVRAICSRKKSERICGQEFPREVIKAAMLKVDRICLENAIEQMKQTDNVRNYEKYLISTLFNEANGRSFRENAEDRNVEYVVERNFGY